MIVTIALALLATASASIEDCGGSSAVFKITDLAQDPVSTVSAGQNVSLTLKYTVPQEVTGGRVVKSVMYNYIPFAPTEEDLCTNAACPLTPGDHDGSTWYVWPSGASGLIDSKVEWYDLKDTLLLCIDSQLSATMKKNYSTEITLYKPFPFPTNNSTGTRKKSHKKIPKESVPSVKYLRHS